MASMFKRFHVKAKSAWKKVEIPLTDGFDDLIELQELSDYELSGDNDNKQPGLQVQLPEQKVKKKKKKKKKKVQKAEETATCVNDAVQEEESTDQEEAGDGPQTQTKSLKNKKTGDESQKQKKSPKSKKHLNGDKLSSQEIQLGVLKYLLRRKRAYKYAFEDEETEERTSRPKLTGFKALVQKHTNAGSLDAFRDSEKHRLQSYRSSLCEEKKQRNRELQRVRQAKHRDKKRREKEASCSTRAAQERAKSDDQERKQAHREKMRLWRDKQTPEKKAYHNMKRMERYNKQKQSPKPVAEDSPQVLDNATPPAASMFGGSPFKSGEARRQAASRASRHDPRDPVKYAEVKAYQLGQAMKSPRKRKALQCVQMPAFKMPAFAERIVKHMKGLKTKKKKKDVAERKKLLSILVEGSTESVQSLSHQLGQRWHFVAAASTLLPEEEELLRASRHGGALSAELCKEVENFYSRPESSVILPDRKLVKKDLVPRACLTSSVANVHQAFLAETNKKISLSAFKKLRPQNIMTLDKLKRTSCLCKMCANIAQKIEVLRSFLPALPATPAELCDTTLCCHTDEITRWTCVDRECPTCGVQVLTKSLTDELPTDKTVSWLKWQPYTTSSGQRIGNITMKGTLADLVAELSEELQPFASHLAVAFWQYKQFRQLREHLPPNQLLTLMDFAENYRCEFQHEVQAAHWSYTQATVLPTVNYYRCTCGELVTESVVFISDDLQHDASAVHACTAQLLHHLEDRRQIKIERQFQFTDGAGNQFKSREPFTDVSCSAKDFSVPIERSFFGSSHGKGPCDGVGGIVKSAVRRAVLSGKEVIRNAEEMLSFLHREFTVDPDTEACCHSRRVFYRLEGVNRTRPDRRPKNPVPGTRAIHCIRPRGANCIMHRRLSCYCADCVQGEPCEAMRKLPHGQWKTHIFQVPQPTSSSTSTPAVPNPPASDVNSSGSSCPAAPTPRASGDNSAGSSCPAAPTPPASGDNSAGSSCPAAPTPRASGDNSTSSSCPAAPTPPASGDNSAGSSCPAAPTPQASGDNSAGSSCPAAPTPPASGDNSAGSSCSAAPTPPASGDNSAGSSCSAAPTPPASGDNSAGSSCPAAPTPPASGDNSAGSSCPAAPTPRASGDNSAGSSCPAAPTPPASGDNSAGSSCPAAPTPPASGDNSAGSSCPAAPTPCASGGRSASTTTYLTTPVSEKTAARPSPPSFFRRILDSMRRIADWKALEAAAAKFQTQMPPIRIEQLQAARFSKDKPSVELYPSDGPSNLIPVTIYGDGNCLPRCGSLLAWGTEERHLEMRARIALELILHKTHYLGTSGNPGIGDLPTFCAQYSEHFLTETLTKVAIARIFELEVKDVLKPGTYMGMWQLLALSTVLQSPVRSIYPEHGGFTVRQHLHKMCTPRDWSALDNPDSTQNVPGIMWTHTQGKGLPALTWRPNHFVVCLPSFDTMQSWKGLGVSPVLLQALEEEGFNDPTPVQALALPDAIFHKMDIIAAAETGSGKTLGFGLPVLENILSSGVDAERLREEGPCALILEPTRELAMQVHKHLKAAARHTNIQVVTVVGGMAAQKQHRLLKRFPHIIVATPGRLWELIQEGDGHLNKLHNINQLVVDEADRMIEKGHFEELSKVFSMLSEKSAGLGKRQHFIFSATLTMDHAAPQRPMKKKRKKNAKDAKQKMDALVSQLDIQDKPKIIDLTRKEVMVDTLTETRIDCQRTEKDLYLYYVLRKYGGRTLVFCNSKDCIRRLVSVFSLLGCSPLPLHSDMHQRQRLKNLDKFAEKSTSLLLASDVAARGLDIKGIDHVVHYQVPFTVENYVHRSGRTARASREGLSVILVCPDEIKMYRNILKLKQGQDFAPFPVDPEVLKVVKRHVDMATSIDLLQHRLKKTEVHKNWMQKAAEEMDIELDEDLLGLEEDNGEQSQLHQDKVRLKQDKQQLTALLKEPLLPSTFSGRYPTQTGQLVMPKKFIQGSAVRDCLKRKRPGK